MSESVGFIGGGRVTRIFLEGWKRAQKMPGKVVVSDCNAEALARLRAQFPQVEAAASIGAAAGQGVVFLAVHPPVLTEVAVDTGVRSMLRQG